MPLPWSRSVRWRLRGPLAQRPFILLISGSTVSYLGNAVAPVALAFAVLRLTGSPTDLGYVLLARTVPMIVLLMVGGVVADRVSRRTLMVITSAVAGATQSIAAVVLLTGEARLWQLVVLEAMNGTATAFLMPAASAVMPQVVPDRVLPQANAIQRIGRNTSGIVGAALAGLVVAAFGSGWGIAADAASFFAAAMLFSGLRLTAVPRPEAGAADAAAPSAGGALWRDLADGWHEFWSRTWLWAVVVQFLFVNACFEGAVNVLGPVVAQRYYGGARAWGLLDAAEGAGLLAGSLLSVWLTTRRRLLVGNTGILAAVPALACLALPAPFPIMAAAGFTAGFGMSIFGVNWSITMQRELPPAKLARLSSYDALGSFVAMPVGQAIAGPMAAAVGLSGAIWSALVIVAAATLVIYAVPEVRTLRS